MISADVLYDKKALTSLMKYSSIDKPWKWVVYALVTLLAVSWFVISVSTSGFSVYYLIILLIAVVIDFLVIYSYFIMPKVKLKSFTEENEVTNHFTFCDDSIRIRSVSKKRTGTSDIKYTMIYKACESKDTFYLFLNKRGALIIKKDCITNGTVEGLRALLTEKISYKRNKLNKK